MFLLLLLRRLLEVMEALQVLEIFFRQRRSERKEDRLVLVVRVKFLLLLSILRKPTIMAGEVDCLLQLAIRVRGIRAQGVSQRLSLLDR